MDFKFQGQEDGSGTGDAPAYGTNDNVVAVRAGGYAWVTGFECSIDTVPTLAGLDALAGKRITRGSGNERVIDAICVLFGQRDASPGELVREAMPDVVAVRDQNGAWFIARHPEAYASLAAIIAEFGYPSPLSPMRLEAYKDLSDGRVKFRRGTYKPVHVTAAAVAPKKRKPRQKKHDDSKPTAPQPAA